MRNNSNKYAQQIGMGLGKARHILTNKIIHEYANIVYNGKCYKCGKDLSAEDISIDHKTPWRNEENAIELFFDLANIAFSHKKCNKTDRPGKYYLPEGMSWCAYHKQMHLIEEFGKGDRWNGLNYICKEADRIRVAKYNSHNPRFKCPKCNYEMRKKCQKCGYEISMAEYMKMRRSEGAKY
jgi:ribosomal protein S27AE